MRRLFLLGEIGCGKSTLIRDALGEAMERAGGFVTVRVVAEGRLLGFDLAPAAPSRRREAGRFLRFEPRPIRDDTVFSELGAALLREAAGRPFAVLDEFGGLELSVPAFRDALWALLRSDVPCVGVCKTPAAAAALGSRVPLDNDYAAQYEALFSMLERDAELLPTAGRGDARAARVLSRWAEIYATGGDRL